MSGRETEHKRDQVGNLVPRDVVEVLALERHSSKGKRRKYRGSSLRRAFSWLRKNNKGKKAYSRRNSQDLLGPGTPVLQPSPKAASKEEDDRFLVPQIFQENVFIESNRHKYVEDLHTEALEGLKLMQQEENQMDTDYQDDQSVISGVTSQNEGGSCSERRRSIGSESTATTDTMSTVSNISSRSTRSALSRQGSTFTPLNQGKKERTKGRRRHRRTTVMGIPRHVQKELGLDRAAWTAYQRSQEPVPSDDITGTAPAVHGPVLAPKQTSRGQQRAPSHLRPRSKDDLALIQVPQGTSGQRPMSLAVPWATTAEAGGLLQHPPSPVMYISPQGTYMSKIIPNAVLPPSVDVVEFNRNRSRQSVRTVSKCSLASASPAPSRASSCASSRASSRRSTLCSESSGWGRSALCSESSGWSQSESSGWSRSNSSETLVSDSSTISSTGTTRASSSGKESVVMARPVKANARPNGQVKVVQERDQATGQFSRSLSVMKRAKKPPPPSRSYSLHKDKMKRRSRDLAEAKIDLSGVTPKGGRERASGGSPGYSADESAVEESFSSGATSPPNPQQQANGDSAANSIHSSPPIQHSIETALKRTLSPSSGYSSHNGTPNIREAHLNSTGDQTSVKSELTGVSSNYTKPAVMALRALFEIPQSPKVTAPPPPPPETWAHNQRTFVLLCGPGPENIKFATPPRRLQAQHGKGEVPSAEIPSSLSVEQQQQQQQQQQRQHTTTAMEEQDSPLVNKRPSPSPHNRNVMQELQKVQQSPTMNRTLMKLPADKKDQSQMASSEKQADAPTGPPLSPPLPPPPPPLELLQDCALTPLDELDLPPPPPLFSPLPPNTPMRTFQGMPQGIPPPPQQPPPPPPQQPPPPPPQQPPPPPPEAVPPPPPPMAVPTPPPPMAVPPPPPPMAVPPPKKDVSSAPQAHAQPNIPNAPPLLVNFNTQSISVTAKNLRKVPPPQKKDPPTTNEDSPVVTPSILQKVRLRSIRSTPKPVQSVTEVAAVEQIPATIQVAPPKPIRRSLLLAEPPPDVAALIADEPKSLPDATEQMSKTEATPKNSESETTLLKSQSEQPVVTSQLPDSTIPDSLPEGTELKSLPEGTELKSLPESTELKSLPESTVSMPQPEPSELASQPEPTIPDSKPEHPDSKPEQSVSKPEQSDSKPKQSDSKPEQSDSKPKQSDSKPEQSDSKPEQSDTQLEQSISIPGSQPAIKFEPVPTGLNSEPAPNGLQSEPEQAESKPELDSKALITESEKRTEMAPPEPHVVVSQLGPAISKTEKTEHETSELATELVAANTEALQAVSESKPEAEATVAQTEQTVTPSEIDSVVSKSEPEETSVTTPLQPSVPPSISSKSLPESSLSVAEHTILKSDVGPTVSIDAPEPESKPETTLLSSKSEPEPAVSQSEPESAVSEGLPATTETNPEPGPAVSKSESISTAAVSTTTTTTTASNSQPTVSTSQAVSSALKTQTNTPTSPNKSPSVKSPPGSVAPETHPEPEPAVSKSESISTAAVSTTTAITTTTASKSQPTITVLTSQAVSTAPKTQTNTPTSPNKSPSVKSPAGSVAPSTRMQEAIRQRAAARAASDGSAKRLSLHSPPATAGGSPLKSPTSTASFIFSKSNKKVVIETSTSPEVQSNLRKTLQAEMAAVPKPGDGQKMSVKVPPPVASKPRAKMQSQRNGLPNPSAEEAVATEVQTAGQGAQSEDTRNTA